MVFRWKPVVERYLMGLSLDLSILNSPLCILIVTNRVSHTATEIDYSAGALVVS
jgi:hypothetical protein